MRNDLYRVPVQMVLVVAVEADSCREVQAMKLKQAPGCAIEVPDMPMKIPPVEKKQEPRRIPHERKMWFVACSKFGTPNPKN